MILCLRRVFFFTLLVTQCLMLCIDGKYTAEIYGISATLVQGFGSTAPDTFVEASLRCYISSTQQFVTTTIVRSKTIFTSSSPAWPDSFSWDVENPYTCNADIYVRTLNCASQSFQDFVTRQVVSLRVNSQMPFSGAERTLASTVSSTSQNTVTFTTKVTAICDRTLCDTLKRKPCAAENDGCGACLPGTERTYLGVNPYACSTCAKGKYNDDSSLTCRDCTQSKYAPVAGASVCLVCGSGSYSLSGASVCIDCVPGEYIPIDSQLSGCAACTLGSVAPDRRSTSCQTCITGKIAIARTRCEDCPAGKYADKFHYFCIQCSGGRYSTAGAGACDECPNTDQVVDAGASSCLTCPAGRIGGDGRTECVDCASGSIAVNVAGGVECRQCAAGRHWQARVNATLPAQCVECAAGRFTAIPGKQECDACLTGTYAPQSGSAVCLECRPGYEPGTGVVWDNGQRCAPCPAGQEQQTHVCESCALGRYRQESSETRMTTCESCPIGRYSNETGRISCSACRVGKFKDHIGAGDCRTCPVGHIAAVSGASACEMCTAGRIANAERTECVVCAAGDESDPTHAQCQSCPPGRYSPLPASQCLTCPSGTFSLGNSSTICQSCTGMLNSVCFGGSITTLGGVWMGRRRRLSQVEVAANVTTDDTARTRRRLRQLSDGGGSSSSSSSSNHTVVSDVSSDYEYYTRRCRPGYCFRNFQCRSNARVWFDNALCAECNDGYRDMYGTCMKCDSVNWLLLSLLVLGSFIVICAIVVLAQSSSGLTTVALFYLQLSIFFISPYDRWLEWMGIFNLDPVSNASQNDCILPLSPLEQHGLRFIVPFLLILELSCIALVHRIIHWRWQSRSSSHGGQDDDDEAKAPEKAKAKAKAKQKEQRRENSGGEDSIQQEGNVVVVDNNNDDDDDGLLVAVENRLYVIRSTAKEYASFDGDRYHRAAISLVLFCYSQILEACISYLHCTDAGDDQRVVYSSPQIDCDDATYKRYIPIAVVLLIGCIAVPIVLVVTLHKYRDEIMIGDGGDDGDGGDGNGNDDDDDGDGDGSDHGHGHVHLQQTKTHHNVYTRWGVVFEFFRPQYYWYNAVFLSRRFLLVILNVLLLSHPHLKSLCFALVSLASLVAHMYMRPFRSRIDNHLEVVSLSSLCCLAMYLASIDAPYSETEEVGVFCLVLLPTICIVSIVIAVHAGYLTDVAESESESGGEASLKDANQDKGEDNDNDKSEGNGNGNGNNNDDDDDDDIRDIVESVMALDHGLMPRDDDD